jgi:uncharacterized protein (TIGR00290 family)
MNALIFWSSGKDACLSLFRVQQEKKLQVKGLLSTISQKNQTVVFHQTPKESLELQASALNLPLHLVELPDPCSNAEYESALVQKLKVLKAQGITHLIFGDLFLKDIREYRENFLKPLGFELVFPLWGENTKELASEFLEEGFQAVISGVMPGVLSDSWVGQPYDLKFLKSLSPEIDPCGEKGEFHTFVTHGPNFQKKVPFFLKA